MKLDAFFPIKCLAFFSFCGKRAGKEEEENEEEQTGRKNLAFCK